MKKETYRSKVNKLDILKFQHWQADFKNDSRVRIKQLEKEIRELEIKLLSIS